MRNVFVLRRLAIVSCFTAGVLACGARTGLLAPEDDEGTVDGSTPLDGGIFIDGAFVQDAPNSLDVQPPTDVFRADCPDSSALLVYTITEDYLLQAFDPNTVQFRTIGRISCPSNGATPFSMAVNRKGVAYVLFTDSNIYQVSTATGACAQTSYVPQGGFQQFGMGFATNDIGPTESLYVLGDGEQGGTAGLAHIDTDTFNLTYIGDDPIYSSAELTGTGDGRLFAFYRRTESDTTSNIGQIDTSTGLVIGERHFDNVDQGNGWAFAFWGGDFYMFHAPNSAPGTVITRYRPSDDSVVDLGTTGGSIIVGAGVSTCAPQ